MTDTNTSGDDELLRRAAAGDEEAFLALYRRRQAGIYRFALNMSGDHSLAEEVTQEVFLTVLREGHRFDAARGGASAYLFGIARNYVLRYRQRDRQYAPFEQDASSWVDEAKTTTIDGLSRTQVIDKVRQAVLSLPPAYREVVVLCDLEEMSYSDAAEVLRVPVGTVRSRLSRGRALLMEKLRGVQSLGGSDVLRCFV